MRFGTIACMVIICRESLVFPLMSFTLFVCVSDPLKVFREPGYPRMGYPMMQRGRYSDKFRMCY